ncbi:MAG TPA: NAD(P)H-dependent oxidoreductase [Vicinamibacterales bacterium]
MTNARPLLQIITASTRRDRKGPAVAAWFERTALAHAGFEIEAVDLAEVNLPLLDEPNHPRFGNYQFEHTKAWSARVRRADAFVFVTPEYNFSAPPSLVNALDYLFHEWAYKPAGFVSYGGVSGGTRSVQMIKQIVTALKVMPMVEAVSIPFFTKFIDPSGAFNADETQNNAAAAMLTELRRWTDALTPLRKK